MHGGGDPVGGDNCSGKLIPGFHPLITKLATNLSLKSKSLELLDFMCGIAGYYFPHTNRSYISHALNFDKLAFVLGHRGPDSHGSWWSDRGDLFFFHSRLAIQDLSPMGHQPMVSLCGRFCISFNGEIYNFRDLSAELLSLGIALRGHSDTEVILEYIAHFGLEKALKCVIGMFAFSLYDRNTERLYLVRDRIGEKPLYWFFDQGKLAFASEIKALKAMIGDVGNFDRLSLGQYFRYGYIPDPRSIYSKIRKVMPGCLLDISVRGDNDCRDLSIDEFSSKYSKTYWSLKAIRNQSLQNPFETHEQAVSEIHKLLKDTIANQSIADVDLGVYLSGGIDSTLVAAVLQSQNKIPVKSFTVGFTNPMFNEAGFARNLASHIGTRHHEIAVSDSDLLELIERLPKVYDEPLANASQIPTILLSKYARQHVKVCLSGDGGDELFAGYNRYLWGAKIACFNQRYSRLTKRSLSETLSLLRKFSAKFESFVAFMGFKPVQNIEVKLAKLITSLNITKESELYDFLLSIWNFKNPAGTCNHQFLIPYEDFTHQSFIDAAMLSDQLHYLPGDNLAKVDRASMAYSLEVRLPLLSHELLTQAWRVPLEMRLKGGQSKSILREILYRYVPRSLVERPKMGFSVPLGEWLRGPLREWMNDLLNAREFRESGLLNVKLIDKAWEEHISKRLDNSAKLWCIFVFLQWQKAADNL